MSSETHRFPPARAALGPVAVGAALLLAACTSPDVPEPAEDPGAEPATTAAPQEGSPSPTGEAAETGAPAETEAPADVDGPPAEATPGDIPYEGSGGGVVARSTVGLERGDCYDDADVVENAEIPTVPCDQPHDKEVYLVYPLHPDPYPGAEAVNTEANHRCMLGFNEFVGIPYSDSVLYISYFAPTEESWNAGDRDIACVVYQPGQRFTGTLEAYLG
ncbi:septum formation family protein [Nocardiopsis sp. LOL_012]|uniref:septum formation family protein n=1 Tax=Nocardiopsis sp. LOL_012 TaxID=3345409 RepID=UPI003A8713F0